MYLEQNEALFGFNAPYPSMRPYELGRLRAANTVSASSLLLVFQKPFAIHLEGVRLL